MRGKYNKIDVTKNIDRLSEAQRTASASAMHIAKEAIERATILVDAVGLGMHAELSIYLRDKESEETGTDT